MSIFFKNFDMKSVLNDHGANLHRTDRSHLEPLHRLQQGARRLQALLCRNHGAPGYENGFEFTLMPERLDMPLKIRKPTKFFVNSMSDLFHERMPFEFLDQVF
jgi:hypothetical protein